MSRRNCDTHQFDNASGIVLVGAMCALVCVVFCVLLTVCAESTVCALGVRTSRVLLSVVVLCIDLFVAQVK